jgi:hypothetical protein
MNALYYNQSFFSGDTLLNVISGGVGGAGGGILASKSFLGLKSELLPAPLTQNDFDSISWVDPSTQPKIDKTLIVMAPDKIATETAKEVSKKFNGDYNGVLNVDMAGSQVKCDTIAAHGTNGSILARINYRNETYLSPMSGKLFAKFLAQRRPLGLETNTQDPIKLISCFGASGNAQTIANELQRPVFAGYGQVDPVNHDTSTWKIFYPN